MILVEDITATYLNLLDSLIDEYKILDENISNPLNTELSLVNYIGCEFTSDYTNLKKVRDMSNKEFIESFLTFNVITNHINSNQSYAQLTQDITEETESTELINRPASFLIFNLYFKTTSKLYFSEHFYIKDSLDYSYSKFINYNSMKFLSEMNKIRLANFDATANTSVSVEDQIALELDNVDALTPNDSRLQTFAKIMDKQREQQEEYKPSINNLTMSGDEEVQELIQKQADLVVQLNKAITTVEKIKDKETAMKGYKRTFSSSNIVEGFKVYFDYLRTSQEVHADNLDTILSLSEANEKSEALVKSPDFCFMIMLGIYSIYASTTGDAISFDDYNSEAAYDRHKNSLSGIQSLPGWIDINQIRHEEWNPQLEALKDSDFWKYYANFYTFSESKTNPFNSLFINDPGFLQQQEYALKGKERLITDRDVLEEKLNNLFYGANELFGNHSLWTFTNLLADLFAELESPFTADILVGGVGDSFMNFFKNISVEITSTLLLEILAKLLEVDFIDIGGQKRSLLDIYNDLLMIQKIFSTMSQMDEEDGLEHSKEMDDLKTTLLSTDNVIGKLLDSKFYFALDGTNQYSTELETFLNSVDYEGLNIDSFFDMLYKNDEGDQWNLFSQNLSAWYMYKVASSFKTYQNPNNIFNSKETSNLYTLVRNSTDIEKQYAFFCAIQPLTGMVQENYFLKLIEDGQFLNGIVTQEEIFLLCEYLPTDQNNAGFNYVENCERLYEDYPQIFIFSGQPDYEYFFSTVDSSMSDFNTAITTNVDVITGILLNQENGILVDTIARLLPTTYLFKNIGRLPIDQWIEKLIGYFDEWILSGLDLITTSLGFEKKRSVAIYERETRYILKTNYERKIRLFSTMIDIVYNDALSMSICLGLTDVTDINVAYEILKNIREEFKKYSPAEQSSSSDLGKDFESNSSSSDNTNQGIDLDTPSNDENLQDIVDQIKDGLVDKEIIISGVTDGSLGNINNPIAIVPSGTGSSSSEEIFEDGFDYITSDEDLLDHIVSGSTRPIVITGGDLGGSLDDFFTPSEDQLIESAKEQIVAGIVKDTLDEIIKSITDTGQDFKQADIVGDIEDANNFVSHDESGKLISVDFSKVSPDKFLNSIVNFDFQDFVNFKYTTLKMFGNNE